MANPFEVKVPNAGGALQALMQGYGLVSGMQKENRLSQARQQAAQAMQGGGDPRNIMAMLMGAGDMQGANAIAQFGQQDWERNFRTAESARQQGNTNRQMTLAEKQAEEKPQYIQHEGPDGQKHIVRLDPFGKGASVVNPTGASQTPSNPYMTGKMNESQSKDGLYASRMIASEQLFRDPKVVEAGQSMVEKGKARLPLIGNFMVSDDYQKFDQAKRDFINATLRRESGAVISDSEFSNADKQYFPQPGDSKVLLEQKTKNRAEAIRGIAAGAGPGYRPTKMLSADNQIVDNPAIRSATAGAPAPQTPSGAPQAPGNVPAQAIAALRQNPNLRAQFDAKYGPGASASVLGQ